MAVHKSLAAALLLVALGACAELSAERPLFAVADQGLPPLTEGIWIAVGEDCAERNVRSRRFPSDCVPMDIRREGGGAWRIAIRVDLISDLDRNRREEEEENPRNGPHGVVMASAVERQTVEGYAPIYVAEIVSLDPERPSIGYAVVAPIGSMPATEMRMIASIGCSAILREGSIEGVAVHYETRIDAEGAEYQELTGCTASSQAAVREAARRTIIENLNDLTQRRYVFVRAN